MRRRFVGAKEKAGACYVTATCYPESFCAPMGDSLA